MKHRFEIVLKVLGERTLDNVLGEVILERTLNVPFPMPIGSKIRTPEADYLIPNLMYDITEKEFITTKSTRTRESMIDNYIKGFTEKGYSISPKSTYKNTSSTSV